MDERKRLPRRLIALMIELIGGRKGGPEVRPEA
jgi:hypothetical protein